MVEERKGASPMSTLIIACRTIEQELRAAMARCGCNHEVLWLESGLHNVPKNLNERIQALLNDCEGFDTVLLAMSFCGNSVVGLKTGNFRLVIPRCDDCICLLLGSQAEKLRHQGAYFLTEGWLKGERNLRREYEETLARYGETRGKRIMEAMLAHYHSLLLVDTLCFDLAPAEAQTRAIAEKLNLQYDCIRGTLDYLCRLLDGAWTEKDFLLVPPHSEITMKDCMGAPAPM